MSGRTRLTRLQAAAMLVAPALRCRLMARLRRVAMTAGPWPVRIWLRSSVKVSGRSHDRHRAVSCGRRHAGLGGGREDLELAMEDGSLTESSSLQSIPLPSNSR